MKIIALTGHAKTGKDTFALKLQRKLGQDKVFIAAFADNLKSIASRNFGYRGVKDEADRQILQTTGDKFRSLQSDFFIAPMVSMMDACEKLGYKYFVITDMRLPNEYYGIRAMTAWWPLFNFRLIRLRRYYDNGLSETSKQHATESYIDELPAAVTIDLPNDPDYDISEYLKLL